MINSADSYLREYFLKNLDYEEAFTISKTRETFKLNNFEIALDSVDHLGKFIEIESTTDNLENKDQILKECRNLLKNLSSKAIEEPKKYGDLMQELINKGGI